MRIAHLSDVHVFDLEAATIRRLMGKRLTGYVNLRLRRAAQHRPDVAARLLDRVRQRQYDHVVITGDMTYLALEREFELVRDLLRKSLAMDPAEVSIVPGNHDVYSRGAYRAARLESYLGPYLTSDLASDARAGPYPFVRLRGPVAIIGLSTAVPRPPLVASGSVGRQQCARLERLLQLDEVQRRTAVVLQHHPLPQPPGRAKRLLEGLADARLEGQIIALLSRGVVLHGHLHRRIQHEMRTSAGAVRSIGATSASLVHEDPDRAAGVNEYVFDDGDGTLVEVRALVLDRSTQRLEPASIPAGPDLILPVVMAAATSGPPASRCEYGRAPRSD